MEIFLYHKRNNQDNSGRNTRNKQGEEDSMITIATETTARTTTT